MLDFPPLLPAPLRILHSLTCGHSVVAIPPQVRKEMRSLTNPITSPISCVTPPVIASRPPITSLMAFVINPLMLPKTLAMKSSTKHLGTLTNLVGEGRFERGFVMAPVILPMKSPIIPGNSLMRFLMIQTIASLAAPVATLSVSLRSGMTKLKLSLATFRIFLRINFSISVKTHFNAPAILPVTFLIALSTYL